MSHWFHRNPLKATSFVKFELKSVLSKESASKICCEIRLRRDKFFDHLRSAGTNLETVETEFQEYLAIFYGFVFHIEDEGLLATEGYGRAGDNLSNLINSSNNNRKERASKLRYLETFVWTNSMLDSGALTAADSWFEVLNVCVNVALWYMKRAAWISGKDDVRETEAKEVHTALRKAAGIFEYVLENSDKLTGMHEFTGSDMERNVLQAYINQCTAEAQEITIARAIELKHSPKLISSLATETATKYHNCDKLLEKYPAEQFEKWRRYFQLKHRFYLAYAYAYLSESLLAEDSAGKAVRACKEGMTSYKLAEELCAKYAQSKGPGFCAKPEQHLFFRRIEPLLNRHMEKAKRENDFIYHQGVPSECPLLEEKASFGLAKSTSFTYPMAAEQWSIFSYAGFDITKAIMPTDFGKVKKTKGLPPVKEEKVYETDKDPTNYSGCTIS